MLWKGIFLVAFAVGTIAVPTPSSDDVSQFFIRANEGSRIVGGDVAPAGSAPWAVSLTSGTFIRSHFCGASLVSERHIVTAAHCIDSVYSIFTGLSTSLRAIVGTNQWNIGGVTYTIKTNYTHQNYLSSTIKNDIGVFVTDQKVVLTNLVQPARLNYDFIDGGAEVRITGWGRIRNQGQASTVLLELFTKTLSPDDCEREVKIKSVELNMRAPDVEGHIEICSYHSSGHGNCHGDSGSALVLKSDSSQVGVVSWGFPCAVGAPDMYARVSGFQEFLEQSLSYY